jgi:hypothetical protein
MRYMDIASSCKVMQQGDRRVIVDSLPNLNRGRLTFPRGMPMRKFASSMCVVLAVLASGFCDGKFDALLEKAKAGNSAAQAEVGRMYVIGGNGVYRDAHEAVKWFTKAAEQGNADGEYGVGVMYQLGRGGPQDTSSAIRWFELAAKQGKVEAQFQLARIYDASEGPTKNPAMAAKYYQQAAAKDQPTAEMRLAQMYETGQGVTQDYTTSMKWYMKLADDNSFAQYKIGSFYELGFGVPKDRAKALEWYRKAAAHGSGQAMVALKKLEN